MNLLQDYLTELHEIRSSGSAVKETSYYPAISNLFNGVGKALKPRVRCIINIKNRGAGIPDGGLFTPDQFQRRSEEELAEGTIPARGVVEIKPTSEDAWVVADGPQVTRYWGKYRQVLVTNYRDFVLVGQDIEGKPTKLETFRLAPNEAQFWKSANMAKAAAERLAPSFEEFLKRVLLNTATLASPQDVAWFLASYAREAKFRTDEGHLPALATIRTALEEALGMKFDTQRGEHFFRSTLIQTLFYGMFSAWVLWSKTHPPTDKKVRFDWRLADYYLRVPIIRKLFREVADPAQLEPLNLPEVLDWACSVLNRVDRASFFTSFDEGAAVQYFYEPFLEAFDPELRKELGVWYTPREVVQYMVERVDRVLREELERPAGLADSHVYVLDPCCGTGAFLVEALNRIAKTLRENGGDALLATDLKKAATERVFGFELLPAPFVVSHLQIGLMLQHHGAPLSDKKKERAGVYLTNALTGWEPPKAPKKLPFVELEEERDAADHVKRDTPILVILGNPPYNGFAGIARVEEERDLSLAYKTTKRAPAPQGQGLNELYVRFYRMAERRIVEKTGQGIVCFISNYSWLDGLCYRPFDYRWIYCEPDTKLLDRGRPEYVPHVFPGNLWIEARQKQTMDAFDRGYVTSSLADNFGNGLSNFFPLLLHHPGDLLGGTQSHPNISDYAKNYLSELNASHDLLFFHAIAILHSPAFRNENQGALRQDWPRIPLPANSAILKTSAALGKEITALLDIHFKVKGVSEPPVRKDLQAIAVIERADKKPLNPDDGDLELAAGWGHAGKGGATMPGRGKTTERPYTLQEGKAIAESVAILGEKTGDVYLNDRVCWRNVPASVWEYTISGYAVIKKWLSYREKELLGRSLSVDEARYVTEMARRIAALVLLGPQLDDSYRAVAKKPYKSKS